MGTFFQELFRSGIYKRSQGRITRQVTFGALVVICALGFYRFHETLFYSIGANPLFGIAYWLPIVLLAVFVWGSFRVVNMPNFADFLIAVEAELNKVSWPTRSELVRASLVVLICIISLALVLFAFDYVWRLIFHFLGIY
jgi:preprotein translocase subunit SecE